MISLLFTAYDSVEFLVRTVRAAQSDIPEAQIIIGYDAGVPEVTRACMSELTDNTITHVVSQKHRRLVAMVNYQLQLSEHEYVAWLADDCEVAQGGLLEAIQCHKESFPDGRGVVSIGVGGCLFPLTTKTFLRSLFEGHLCFAWPGYTHYCWDTELHDRATAWGLYKQAGRATHHRIGHVRTGDSSLYTIRQRLGWPFVLPVSTRGNIANGQE